MKRDMQGSDCKETNTVWIAAGSSLTQCGADTVLRPGEQDVDEHPEGTWEKFEAWIRDTIGSDFRWRVRPQDTPSNREMVASLILDGIRRNNGVFPERNAFIERLGDVQEHLY